MARWLKQSTSVDVPIGPFLDSTDAITAETGLTITQPDIRLKKNGGAWAQKAAAQTLSHEENGYYEVTLDATDTNTLGLLRLAVAESGALPIWEDFVVVPANVWDSLFGADALQVHAVEISNNLITAASIASDAITAAKIADGAIDAATFAASAITSTVLANDAITAAKIADGAIDAATFAAGAINAAAIASDAITAAKIADGAIDAATFAANAITSTVIANDAITDAKVAADVTIASVTGAVGSVTGAVGSVTGAVGSVTGAVGSVTGNVGGNVVGTVASVVGNVGGNVTGSVGSVVAEVTADMVKVSGDSGAADRLEAMMDGILVCQVNDTAATTTAFAADGFTEATDDHFNGRLITFLTGNLAGQQTAITDYDAAGHAQGNQAFVVDALTEAPANNDTFVIH